MKRIVLTTLAASLAVILVFVLVHSLLAGAPMQEALKVGFVFENDESAPYTYNFSLAVNALQQTFGDRVEVYSCNNVVEADTGEMLAELERRGCRILFVNNYSEQVIAFAAVHPNVQLCQVAYRNNAGQSLPENYHTFNGKIYQGRYVSGIAAGMKLREMIDGHTIDADEALVGYVAAFPTPEVISGYTAFLMGVRSVAPEATMRVRYTNTWYSYNLEKTCAAKLIDEGCIIISQHTDTIGPAIACEKATEKKKVYHVGYNQSMIDVAPTTSLVSTRVNWVPYITGAVGAVLNGDAIERSVSGDVHGNDICAGFERDWVQILDLNKYIAAYGTEERMNRAIEAFRRGGIDVFRGDYTGVDPDDPADTCDLRQGFTENADSSSPSFHYILDDVIIVEN